LRALAFFAALARPAAVGCVFLQQLFASGDEEALLRAVKCRRVSLFLCVDKQRAFTAEKLYVLELNHFSRLLSGPARKCITRTNILRLQHIEERIPKKKYSHLIEFFAGNLLRWCLM
jgi:hypothetical protein